MSWTKNGDMNIYGKFYYPEDFDASQSYPTVIMSHGLGSTAAMVERAQWPQAVVREGYDEGRETALKAGTEFLLKHLEDTEE